MSRRVVCGGARRGRAMADCSRGGDASFAKAETSASTGHLAYLGAQGRTGSVNHARGSRGRRGAGRGLTRRCEKWVRSVRPADMRAPICPRAPRRASAPPAGVARRRRRGSLALPCSAERWSRAPAALPRAAPQGREGGVAGSASSASCVVECCPTRPAPRSAHRAQPPRRVAPPQPFRVVYPRRPPPRAPSDPPRPACARAGGGAGQRMAPTCLWRASVARAVSKVASWMSKLAPSPSATSGWHGRVSPEHTTLHPRAPGSGGARSSTPVAWRHECRTSTVLIATPSRAASCERAPP